MLYFCTENERNLFSIENRPVGFYTECLLSPDLFKLIANMWGPFDVDRMACSYNSHLPRFNSKFWCPGTEAVDCFTQDWGKDCNNFVCPPPHLISAVLYHMENCEAKGTLVVPEWISAPFWPLLCSYDCPFLLPEFVKDFCYLPRSRDMFLLGRGSSLVYTNKKSVFSGVPKFNVLAFRLNFAS